MDTKYLYIRLEIQDGDREHTHHVLTETTEDNLEEVVQEYSRTYWGEGECVEDDVWMFNGGEFAIELYTWKELTKEEYELIFNTLYR